MNTLDEPMSPVNDSTPSSVNRSANARNRIANHTPSATPINTSRPTTGSVTPAGEQIGPRHQDLWPMTPDQRLERQIDSQNEHTIRDRRAHGDEKGRKQNGISDRMDGARPQAEQDHCHARREPDRALAVAPTVAHIPRRQIRRSTENQTARPSSKTTYDQGSPAIRGTRRLATAGVHGPAA